MLSIVSVGSHDRSAETENSNLNFGTTMMADLKVAVVLTKKGDRVVNFSDLHEVFF